MELLGMSFRLDLDSAQQTYVLQESLKYHALLSHMSCACSIRILKICLSCQQTTQTAAD